MCQHAAMTLPPPQPPQPLGPPGPPGFYRPVPQRQVMAGRRRLGWRLMIGAAIAAVALLGTLGWKVYRLFTSIERTSTPGTITIECHTGDDWRIGPLVARSNTFGPVTVNEGFAGAIGTVEVTAGDVEVPVRSMGGGFSETFSVNGSSYLAVATFECPTDATTTVRFVDDTGGEVAVFPPIGRAFVVIALMAIGGLLIAVVGAIGLALAIRHRRSLEPA
jgi:hypothetical protein